MQIEKFEKLPEGISFKQTSSGKYAELQEMLMNNVKVGEWVKVSVSEKTREDLDREVHAIQTSMRSWKRHMLKQGSFDISFSQYRKYLSLTEAEIWIRLDKLKVK